MKNFFQKILNLIGYKLLKIKSIDKDDTDEITKFLIDNQKPVIFDVGANKGQSITRYKKLFKDPIIHSFEPNAKEVDKLNNKYEDDKKVFLNNVAIGEKQGSLEFNINAISGHSSFKNLIPNTTWIKKRSQLAKVESKKYTIEKVLTKIITLDDYAKKNKINEIDILKIDTQGYEDKVLQGSEELLKNKKIKMIKLELIFSEIYEKPLQIFDVEKFLITSGYKLFGVSNGGSLITHYIFQSDLIYVSPETYDNFKSKSPYFNN
tara:strand:- start:2449 stop:3237 length:789 start_codon:yes stop_codon:yes gene_type:complete